MDKLKRLENKLARTLKALNEAESLLEHKSKELYSLNQSLEQLVIERTTELEEAKNIAVNASKAKDRFVANISHELRTPLNGIIGMLSFLKKTELTEEQKGFLKLFEQSSDMLLSLINDILDQVKITSGKMSLEITTFSPEELVESVINILYFKAFEAGVSLNFNCAPSTFKQITSDQRKVSQILINLIGNSIKFSPKGHIQVNLLSSENKALFEVIDSGIGIPKDKMNVIFKPFLQVDESDNRKYGGSGLGLSISKSFIEALGGEISVSSQESIGTTFTFTIENQSATDSTALDDVEIQNSGPIALCISNSNLEKIISTYLNNFSIDFHTFFSFNELLNSPQKKTFNRILISEDLIQETKKLTEFKYPLIITTPSFEKGDKHSNLSYAQEPFFRSDLINFLNNKSPLADLSGDENNQQPSNHNNIFEILLVEDNLINQKVASYTLETAGYSVAIANHGAEAVEMCQQKFYPIILMDFHMPVMNGIEATKAIRKIQENQSKRSSIVAMTANAMKSAKEECYEAGMDDFITKPINPDSFIEHIKRLSAKLSQN